MTDYRSIPLLFILVTCTFWLAQAQAEENRVTEDKTHVHVWNQFAADCLALSHRLVASRAVRTQSHIGGYQGRPDFYREENVYDQTTGKLISKVQWERENPSRLHAIEVYVRDQQGRTVRDYAAAYLPDYRNAPMQTLINLHAYNGELHSFRQFDASGDRTYEFCEGNYRGKPVQIRLFENDLFGNSPRVDQLMASKLYQTCFQGIPANADAFLKPH